MQDVRKLTLPSGVAAAVLAALTTMLPEPVEALTAGNGGRRDKPPVADVIGCYRLGFSGYHWYRSCFGPYWLYPHHRSCRHGWCGYYL